MTGIALLQAGLQPYARALYDLAQRFDLGPVITSTYRTREEQARLSTGRAAGRSRYPAARPGHSLHELGLAFDMTVRDPSVLPVLGRVWRSWGGRWGGAFGDPIHFDTGLASRRR